MPAEGSLWHRWDPHLHAPGTLQNDQFDGNWGAYLAKINGSSPPIRALGVTDYFCIRTYRSVKDRWKKGALPGIAFIFPNVEMRLDIKTEKKLPINLHLLFSPDDPNHESEIERILGRLEFEYDGRSYQCTPEQLASLGNALDPTQSDSESAMRLGAQQFKVTLDRLKRLFDTEKWLQQNCLVAVAGSSNDGTAGLQADDSYALMRRNIERFADIVFASTPSQREFWLGKRPGMNAGSIEKTYRSLKPCLHGSDAHSESSTGAPSLNRFCWIKGDLTFETLRQVVLEPERRVAIGEMPPQDGGGTNSVIHVNINAAPWLSTSSLLLNSGLIAIIGSRGSGKSALVEMLAHGARCSGHSLKDSSFLVRAAEHFTDERVELRWADDETTAADLLVPNDDSDWLNEARFRYLSQQFVERLCSGTGLATELRGEIERVVFESIEPSQRMQATSFAELVALHDEPIRQKRTQYRAEIDTLTDAIVAEDKLLAGLKETREERQRQGKILENARNDLGKLIPKEAAVHAKRLATLESAFASVQLVVEGHKRRRKSLEDLSLEVKSQRATGAKVRLVQLKTRFADARLADTDWEKFDLQYRSDVEPLLTREIAATEMAINLAVNGQEEIAIDTVNLAPEAWPLMVVERERDALKVKVGIDVDQQRRYLLLQREIVRLEGLLQRLDGEITRAEGAATRRAGHLESRRLVYRAIFDSFSEEEQTLNDLYAPLKLQLADGTGALGKLRFVVLRQVDVDEWISRGDPLLDLRKATAFKGDGSLKAIIELDLLSFWKGGSSEDVSRAMQTFLEKYRKELITAMPNSVRQDQRGEWMQQLAAWLYDTSHIEMQYSLRYDGIPIEKLSPGTRGIVLLLLYLVLDKSDLRPLVIDQPEENLDPQSVFEELVPHFRDARARRQVIIVTHNANLVVNTDADQVIVASAAPSIGGGLPTITYRSGSLENGDIRRKVCEILEGGERAFKDRAKRYRFRVS
jgi:ABC-type lipoprotein export system ATPase subunit